MGLEFRCRYPIETWKFLWVVGIMFIILVLTLQHFELPPSNILLSLYFVRIDQTAKNGSLTMNNSSLESETVRNDKTLSDSVNSTDHDSNGKEKFIGVLSDMDPVNSSDNRFVPEKPGERFSGENIRDNTIIPYVSNDPVSESSMSFNKSSGIEGHGHKSTTEQDFPEENVSFSSENPKTSDSVITSIVPVSAPEDSLTKSALPGNSETRVVHPVAKSDPDKSAMEKNTTSVSDNHANSVELNNKSTMLSDISSANPTQVKKIPKVRNSGVISVSEMHSLLQQSWSFPNIMRSSRWASSVDGELLHAKSQIQNAPIIRNDPILYASLYWNISVFKRSYELMEEILKVYVYKEGEKPILHQPILQGIYASEGWFMKLLEANKKFVTKKPRQAHLFYLPFSSRNLELQLYVPDSHNRRNLVRYLEDYLDLIAAKYPFWNRTEGVDHFLVACHDWAASETKKIMSKCIRSLCNADVKQGFVFGKDASLPETNVRMPQNPVKDLGGKPPSKRSILAFFAGSMHGYLRPLLLKHWENKDPDMIVVSRMPKVRGKMNNYVQHMKRSKYCICPRGYEVNSPRIVEAIMYECVPVIISDNYVPPFLEILNWESFAVFILEKDIPNLKNILVSIPKRRYREMQMRVKKVQQHFLWHAKPVKYDLFHMILHSVWYKRVFQMQP